MVAAIRDTAIEALGLGISVLPPTEDGIKRPMGGEWKRFQAERASVEQVVSWYGSRTGLGFVCGGISGGLELFEFDDRETYRRFKETAAALGGADLIGRIEDGYLEETPGGGVHWFYFTDEIRGSTKLAVRRETWADGKVSVQTLIETKGEGGFVIVAPTFGRVHPSGKPYRLIKGGLRTIARIGNEDRDWLWDLARVFNEDDSAPPVAQTKAEIKARDRSAGEWPDTVSPGNDFNGRASWDDILSDWRLVYRHGDTQFWRRPGKDFGHSATVNHTGTDHLHVFSSSTEFEPGVSYSKFGAYARLHHRGDYSAAAKQLYEDGYGTHKRWVLEKGRWVLRVFPNPCPRGEKYAKPGQAPPDGPAADSPSPLKSVDPGEFEALTDEELGLVSADTLKPEPIRWEWENRIARGKLNLLAGEGGDGKSQIATAIMAAISAGGCFPDGSGPVEPGTCFILAAEDGARDTILPRLIAAGADLTRVKINKAKVSFKDKNGKSQIHPVSFQDLPYWRVALTRHKVRLLVADPIPAYLGRGINDNRNNEVRAVLEPFVDLLDELGVALIAITHLNKSTDQKTPTHKILGSVAYANLARTVHCTYRDPDDNDRRFFCMVKSNVVSPQGTLAFRVKPFDFDYQGQVIKTSKIEFEGGPVAFSPAALLNGQRQAGPGPSPTKSLKVAEFLYDFLFGNGWMPLAQIIEAAGTMNLLGEQKADGKWSCVTNLYRAQERVHELPEPKHGFTVDAEKMAFKGYGKVTPHWKLTPVDLPEPADDRPF